MPAATGEARRTEGDAQPAALAFTVPAATGEARRTEGDAQPAALAFTVPAATGEARRTEGDAQPAAFAFEAAAATGGRAATPALSEKVGLRSLSGSEPTWAIEVSHPSLATPVRLVSDGLDHIIAGDTYTALRFRAVPPQSREGQVRQGMLEVDNVGRPIAALISDSKGLRGATVRLMRLTRTARVGNTVQSVVTWETILAASVSEITAETVRIGLGDRRIHGTRAVTRRHDPTISPGLF